MNMCPLCGNEANFLQIQGITVSICSHCFQASVLERNMIIRISPDKITNTAPVYKDLLMVALVAQALYKNWHTVIDVPMAER